MGISSKAILFGDIPPSRISAALDRAGYANEIFASDTYMTRLSVSSPQGPDKRILHVFSRETSMFDHEDIYAGERTLCSLGGSGFGETVVAILAKEFGGFHVADDSDAEDVSDWTQEKGANQVELTTSESLRVAFQRAFPTTPTSEAFDRVESDLDGLADLRDAISAYLEEMTPSIKP